MSGKPDYKKKIAEIAAEEKRASRIDYQNVAFVLVEPYGDLVKGPFQIRDRNDHKRLLEEAKTKQLYLWYGQVTERDDKKYLVGHRIIDWESVPDKPYKYQPIERKPVQKVDKYPTDLKCSICGYIANSTSGYTLHSKTHNKIDVDDNLKCQYCGRLCSSQSGLTLHLKYQHGDGQE